MTEHIIWALVAWNVVVFLVYGVDKLYAVKGAWRIRERALILCALLFGSAGAAAGIVVFRHKIRKKKFLFLIPVCAAANIAAIYFILECAGS